ncbi:putative homing endonuclease [Campylobacter phage F370]|uniref:Putative homing endonuclease n=4 Tax=Fletchervirus CPX TaxID=1110702 RepID=A0A7T3KJ01_9CAUD|nr:putative homing endonuclease [Campylobacter phage F348]QPX63464.1 putative homing endonuclease [Campylobacter phage F352]QPX65110.1 putative homing endonuclease [Campylobacter phage F370]QPX65274.1 putative homing endonuclease [Campylobacter phage F371]QPX65600.1 putative homing endonuclease [Campylobacter phage F374]QPX65767.1 putative homing endonuclease [Campylobacter phage F375]
MDKVLFLNDLGYKPISQSMSKDLEVECKNGHIFKRPFSDFKRGRVNCPKCEVQAKIELLNNLGYEIISNSLGNDLEVRCKNGHIFKKTFSYFKTGCAKCPVCEKTEKHTFLNNLGYKVISENLADHLKVECKNGHTFKRPFSDFKKGVIRCLKCEEQGKINFLHNLGYEIITDNLNKSMIVKCKNKHTFKRDFDTFKKGFTNCPECEKQEKILFLENLKYTVISNNLSKNLVVQCKHGHTFKRDFITFKQGSINCPECEKQEKINFLHNLGYEILSENLSDKLIVKCKKGHTFTRNYGSFKEGITICLECEKDNKISYLSTLGYEIVSDNMADNLQVKCNKGHVFNRTYSNFKKGQTICPICDPFNSSFENEVSNILNNYIKGNRSILDGKELDFYLPDHNLAIECNGDYWHSESNGKGKDYHLDKTERCESKGIQLLHVFESSWNEKKDIWTSIISNKLGKSKKIMARKCILREVSKTEEKEFLESNHLQGFTGSTMCYGLYYQDKLVCLMSFGKPRFTDKYDWELIRLCTKMGVNVIGGASKLLSYFHRHNKGSLISYSDRLYSNGEIYKKLGFTFSHYSKPGYFYFKNNRTYSRQQFMKHKLKDKLEKFNPNLTEAENMVENGYHKVWDCGQGVWVKMI